MLIALAALLFRLVSHPLRTLHARLLAATRLPAQAQAIGVLGDLLRSKPELVAENALLRQQLIVLRLRSKRPAFTRRDRLLLVLLARQVRAWRQALLIVQPETLLRWHRAGFRLLWRRLRRRAPVSNFDDLLGDFWPDDETADEFTATIRRSRDEGGYA